MKHIIKAQIEFDDGIISNSIPFEIKEYYGSVNLWKVNTIEYLKSLSKKWCWHGEHYDTILECTLENNDTFKIKASEVERLAETAA